MMINVVMVAGQLPRQESVLVKALKQLRDHGANVVLVGDFSLNQLWLDPSLAQMHSLTDAANQRGAVARSAQPARRVWLRAWSDPWVRERVRTADVVVALDTLAVHAVWQIAQRRLEVDACYGLGPALKAVDARRNGAPRSVRRRSLRVITTRLSNVPGAAEQFAIDRVRSVLPGLMGPAVVRFRPASWLWRRAVSVPGIPDRKRSWLARQVHVSLVRADRPREAARATSAALARMKDRRVKAELLVKEAAGELAWGHVPTNLPAAVTAQLAIADEYLAERKTRAAAQVLYKTLRLIFNRVLHFDQASSPLASNPEMFLAPLWRSAAAQALYAPRGRSAPAASPPRDRPLRLLIATNGNDHFLGDIRRRYEQLPNVELRFVHLAEDPLTRPLIYGAADMVECVLGGQTTYGKRVADWLQPHLDWADTVFVDWCVATAVLVTLSDPGSTRIIVRLHSFEALSFWPHLVDFSRVDDLVFVSDHLADLTASVLPQLMADAAPRQHVISNAMDLTKYPRDKAAAARFTLGLIGMGDIVKDPRWSIDVLRLLRQHDARYRLLLFGNGPNPEDSRSVKAYHDLFLRDVEELAPSGALALVGHVEDVPSALTEVGVILSSSVRESFHCALVEGAASGAVPIVRDWPFFAGKAHGARTLFPADWVVATPAEAVQRILATTATEEGWRQAGEAASVHALSTWDWSVTQRQFDSLLLGTDMPVYQS